MSKFAIMRHVKHKQGGNLQASLQHNFRERETPNADKERTPDNEHLISSSTTEVLDKLKARLPDKVRKNGVVAVEYMMTASPEFFKENDKTTDNDFFKSSMDWLEEKHGKENIISATIHRDETTPHLAVFIVPITQDGRLSARDYLGGRKLLSEAQTSYAKKVGHLGLERGVEKSKAQHKTIQEYYHGINDKSNQQDYPKISLEDVTPRITKSGILKKEYETPYDIANRLNRKIRPVFKEIAEKANSRRFERQRAEKDKELLITTEKRLEVVKKNLKNETDFYSLDFSKEEMKAMDDSVREKRKEKYIKYIGKMEKETLSERTNSYSKLTKHQKAMIERYNEREVINYNTNELITNEKSKKQKSRGIEPSR